MLPGFVVFLTMQAAHAVPVPIHLEAENARLSGTEVSTERAGYSGRGYVTDFTADADKIVWQIPNVQAGLYEVKIRYSSPFGEKGYDLVINGAKVSNMFAPTGEVFATVSAGKIELRAGTNTIAIESGWGYYDVDALDLVPVVVNSTLPKPPKTLVDPAASPEARALFGFLVDHYGTRTLSGQYDKADNDYIRRVTGQLPAIYGGDLIEYSPSRVAFGSHPEGTSEKLIQVARSGQIITLSWHWNAPSHLLNRNYTNSDGETVNALWWNGFNANATTFDLQKVLSEPNSEDYRLLLRDIDAIAVELKKFSAARVPVLWRPLHEAEGGWFWWGAKGSGPFKQLWRLMFNRLTRVHHLHNLIWVYTAGSNPDWYPGDSMVDVVGTDSYPSDASDPLSATWDDFNARYGGRKLLALTEFGHTPDVERMRRFGVRWSYFVSWSGDLGPRPMDVDVLKRLYTGVHVLNQSAVQRLMSATSATP